MNLIQDIKNDSSFCELNKAGNFLYAYDSVQNILEVDIKHKLIFVQKLKYPPVNVKCLTFKAKPQYFIVNLNHIENSQGTVYSSSNSKSQFTGCLDSYGSQLLFSKYHVQHKKHSINLQHEDSKKILKLTDKPIQHLFFNQPNHQIIYSTDKKIMKFSIQKPEHQSLIMAKSHVLHDTENIYLLTNSLEDKAKQFYQCGIFDSKTGKNADFWQSKQLPFQIQMFDKMLIVVSLNNLSVFDVRKLRKPFLRENINNITSFLYEPNLNKFYLGTSGALKIYTFIPQ